MKPKLFVLLGRTGDIINCLPVFRAEAEKLGEPARVMVSKEFAGILSGVTYVDPVVWDGSYHNMALAVREARASGKWEVVEVQVYGNGYVTRRECVSFVTEQWDRAGSYEWDTLPLVFDHRDRAAEGELIDRLVGKDKRPLLLVSLSGHSSPFTAGPVFYARIYQALARRYNIVDLSKPTMTGERPIEVSALHHLLGLFERAAALITTDSAPLHLAASVPNLPVVMLYPEDSLRYNVSAHRAQQIMRVPHRDAINRIPAIIEAINAKKGPPLLHLWSDFRPGAPDPETARRMELARMTWETEYKRGNWVPLRYHRNHAERTSASAFGDSREMPFIRDMLDYAATWSKRDDSIIVLTNADVCFTPGLTGWVLDAIASHGSAFTHRWDFAKLVTRKINERHVGRGAWYPGSDAFAFTVGWWKANRERFPDMVLGCECWDLVMRNLIRLTGGTEIERAIYHEKHASFWEQPSNHNTNPGNVHNRALSARFFRDNPTANPNDWRVRGAEAKRAFSAFFGNTVQLTPAIRR